MKVNGTIVTTGPGVGLMQELLINTKTKEYTFARVFKIGQKAILLNLIDENSTIDEIISSINLTKLEYINLIDAAGNGIIEEDLEKTFVILKKLTTQYNQVWYFMALLDDKVGYFAPMPYISFNVEE